MHGVMLGIVIGAVGTIVALALGIFIGYFIAAGSEPESAEPSLIPDPPGRSFGAR